MTPFGVSLRSLRDDRGLNQTAFAGLVALDAKSLSAIETGRRPPPDIEVIRSWGVVLGLTAIELSDLEESALDSPYVIRLPRTLPPRELRLVHHIARAVVHLKQDHFTVIQNLLQELTNDIAQK